MTQAPLRFTKMQGCGNDFVVLDCRDRPFTLDRARIRRLGDRHFGVGFDQLLSIERTGNPDCAFAYRVWNSDGNPARQCGNGVRCIAAWLHRAAALGPGMTQLQGPVGCVAVEWLADERVRVDMGTPKFAPQAIPLDAAQEHARYALEIAGRRVEFGAVSIGNPHALVEVESVADAAVAEIGPELEHAPVFPEGCNVGFVETAARDSIRLRVWERGVGETLACGSGACAAVAILHRRGTVDARVRVELPGGTLEVAWPEASAPIWLTGPATFVFEGEWAH
ncbi:MAG: diaminopimelate epimerase [Rhodanobacteraceae bacterium]